MPGAKLYVLQNQHQQNGNWYSSGSWSTYLFHHGSVCHLEPWPRDKTGARGEWWEAKRTGNGREEKSAEWNWPRVHITNYKNTSGTRQAAPLFQAANGKKGGGGQKLHMSEPETACIPNGLLKLVQCQSAGRRKPDKRAALLMKSPCVAVGMLQVFDVAILIRPVSFPRRPSESAMIAIQGHNRREIALYSPDLVGQHPKEAVAERWAVAFEKKANDFAGWALDMLDRLGLKHKD